MKDSPNLDALRACAVGFVVLSHLPYFVGWEDTGSYGIKALGHLGVAIFFVHTTLVLMMSLERIGHAAGPFLIRRFFRIFPLSMVVVLLMSMLQWLGGQPIEVAGVISNLLLLQHVTGHRPTPDQLWTLSYEVMMYLLLPALFVLTSAGRPALRIGAIYSASLVLGLFVWRELSFLAFVPCFLPGAIAFVIGQRGPGRHAPWMLFMLVAVAALAVPALTAAGAPEAPLLWVTCLALGLVVPRCRNLTCRPAAIVSKAVATYSYGIYLTHLLAMGLAFPAQGAPTLLNWALFAIMLRALAMVCYYVIERHGIRLGQELASRFSPEQRLAHRHSEKPT
jgi:peptidoglycan/LPS O-acetylase OafA/YrhL